MKKIITMTAILLFAASASFAASAATGTLDFTKTGLEVYGDDATAGNDVPIGQLSTGVTAAWNTDELGYAFATQHESGTKAYGTSYDSTAIYQTPGAVDPGTAAFTGGKLNATDTTDFTDWNKM